MSNVLPVTALEQLQQFVNDNGVIEIAIRGKNRRFKAFQNIVINDLQRAQESESLQNLCEMMKKNLKQNTLNAKKLESISKIGNLNLILSGANFCATCVGFAIIYKKLDNMSAEIDQRLKELQKNVKDIQDIQAGYQFNNIIAEHMNMLDRKKVQKPYSEEKMRVLVDGEYNVLSMLIEVFKKDVSNDKSQLLFSIFSLASMLTASLVDYDELYYFNNKEAIQDNNYWHIAHDKWTGVFDTLSSQWFIEKLQDHGTFDLGLDTLGVDIYWENLEEQVADMKQEIEDNMDLIRVVDDNGMLRELKNYYDQEVKNQIEKIVEEASNSSDPALEKACKAAIQCVA